jgi:RHS repeat-associated protein
MNGRSWSNENYRFGFNGKELDPEGMGGGGSTYDYGFRIYNAQLGKFLSVDPLMHSFPFFTPFQFCSNNPLVNIDLDGCEGISATCADTRSLECSPPSPMGVPFIVFEYKEINSVWRRRQHYYNIDPSNPRFSALIAQSNQWDLIKQSNVTLWRAISATFAPKEVVNVGKTTSKEVKEEQVGFSYLFDKDDSDWSTDIIRMIETTLEVATSKIDDINEDIKNTAITVETEITEGDGIESSLAPGSKLIVSTASQITTTTKTLAKAAFLILYAKENNPETQAVFRDVSRKTDVKVELRFDKSMLEEIGKSYELKVVFKINETKQTTTKSTTSVSSAFNGGDVVPPNKPNE